jgi:hypothetical protein
MPGVWSVLAMSPLSRFGRPVIVGVGVLMALAIGACASAATAPPTTTPTAPPTAVVTGPVSAAPSVAGVASAAPSGPGACPTATAVGYALGITVSAPVAVPGGGASDLPAGATAIACDYHGTGLNVIVEEITNVDPSYLGKFTAKFPVAPVAVPGLGDQADSFKQALNGGKDNEGVVATKGSTIVDITATGTPATLTQLETLVGSLF